MKFRLFALAAAAAAAGLIGLPATSGAVTDPSELSPANRALFTVDHLASITDPEVLVYDFEKKGTMEPGFKDTVEVRITKVSETGAKDLVIEFLTGKNRVEFPPYFNLEKSGNPIFFLFLERDVREMQRLTGGNALYFRNRILNALAGSAEMRPIAFTHDGKEYQGTEIRIRPYERAELSERFPKFAGRTYFFVLCEDLPGGFYKVGSTTPVAGGGEPLTDESVTFHEMRKYAPKKAERGAAAAPPIQKTMETVK